MAPRMKNRTSPAGNVTRPHFAHRGGLHFFDGSLPNPIDQERADGKAANSGRSGVLAGLLSALAPSVPAHAFVPQNTLEAFCRALGVGCGGIETDVWRTEDGQVVVHHDPWVRKGTLIKPAWMARREDFGPQVPTLEEVYEVVGTRCEISLDCRQRSAGDAAMEVAAAAGESALSRLWLCSMFPHDLVRWKERRPEVRVVDSIPPVLPTPMVELRFGLAARLDIDAVNLHSAAWTSRLVERAKELGLLALAWGVNSRSDLKTVTELGVDGIYSDYIPILEEFAKKQGARAKNVVGSSGKRAHV